MQTIHIQQMDAEAFAPYGDLIDFDRDASYKINSEMCDRYHALAKVDLIDKDANSIISLGRAKPYKLPLTLEMVERHPLGSQAFIPLQSNSFLVVVAPETDDGPGIPLAFLTRPGQGINYLRNTWHSVLTPLEKPTDFLIVDRDGDGGNLEEHFFSEPYIIAKREI